MTFVQRHYTYYVHVVIRPWILCQVCSRSVVTPDRSFKDRFGVRPVFRSVVVLKSCLVMSCWNLHVFLRLTVILLLLFLQVSPFFLCALAHITSYNYAAHLQTFRKKTPAATQRYLGSGDHSAELWYQRYQRCCLAAISSLEFPCDLGNSSNHRVSYVWD